MNSWKNKDGVHNGALIDNLIAARSTVETIQLVQPWSVRRQFSITRLMSSADVTEPIIIPVENNGQIEEELALPKDWTDEQIRTYLKTEFKIPSPAVSVNKKDKGLKGIIKSLKGKK